MAFKVKIALLCGLLLPSLLCAKPGSIPHMLTKTRFTFDNVQVPGNPRMGLLGLHKIYQLNSWHYIGFAGYGAFTGNQGGLFVLGVETGLDPHLFGSVYLANGIFIGGGGGKGSQKMVGGGLMINSHLGLSYHFKYAALGLTYSQIKFPSGDINSQQLGLVLDIPSTFYYLPPYSDFNLKKNQYRNYVTSYVAPLAKIYWQKKGTKNTAGQLQDGIAYLPGIEFGYYLTPHNYALLQLAASAHGIKNGYMDVLLGLGHLQAIGDRWGLVLQGLVGAGGGGGVETGGGLLLLPELGLNYQLSENLQAQVSGGYMIAPDSNWRNKVVTLQVNYLFSSLNGLQKMDALQTAALTHWRIRAANETYFAPKRENNAIKQNIQLINLKFDRIFGHHFYLTGQGAFAYAGHHAGSYATGLLGAGVQTAVEPHHFNLYAEALVGAAGGGGLAVHQGAIVQPSLGLNYQFTPYVGLQADLGRVIAFKGGLNSTVLNVGLAFSFDQLTIK